MKTTLLSLALIGITYCANAQVGVGTDTPQSTLDVKEKRNATVNDASAHDGVLIPKLTKAELAAKATTAYTINQNGAIIYVSDITAPTGSPASIAQVANIDVIGFYYFDGNVSVWKIFDTNTNLFNINGALSSNRVVSQGTNTMSFVNTTTTPTGNKVGIGTVAPTEALDVVGNVKVSSLANATNKIVYADAGGVLKLVSPEELNAPKAFLNTSQLQASQSLTIYDGPCYKPGDNTSSCTVSINHYSSCSGFQTPVSTQVVVMNGIDTSGIFSGNWTAKFIDNKGYAQISAIANQPAPDYPRISYPSSGNTATYLGSGTSFGGSCTADIKATINATTGNLKLESIKTYMYTHLLYLVGVSRSSQ